MEIGCKLKNARNEKGITQEQAAELLDVSRQTISNWENNKSYPDIISVIKMSDIYSVSLDHLLKEEKSMNQTYQEFLEESTNTVKAKKTLGKSILLSAYFIIWAVTMIVVWQANGYSTLRVELVFRWLLLPLFLLIFTDVLLYSVPYSLKSAVLVADRMQAISCSLRWFLYISSITSASMVSLFSFTRRTASSIC